MQSRIRGEIAYRAGLSVVLRDGVVNIDEDTGLLQQSLVSFIFMSAWKKRTYVASVDARNRDKRSWVAAATVGDLDLATGDVELSTAVGLRDVQGNSLHADEVSVQVIQYSVSRSCE